MIERHRRRARVAPVLLAVAAFLFGPALGIVPTARATSCPYLIYATDDSYTMLEDAALTVDAPGVLSNDCGFVPQNVVVKWSGVSGDGTDALNSNGGFYWKPGADVNTVTGGDMSVSYSFNAAIGISNVANVHVTVTPVNDKPIFGGTCPTPIRLVDGDGPQVVSCFSALAGPLSDEYNQTLTGHLVLDTFEMPNPNLFAISPTYTLTKGPQGQWFGTLRFTTAAHQSGSANVLLSVTDNGGRLNGGSDTSDLEYATIIVAADRAPVARDDAFTATAGQPLVVPAAGVLKNDSDPDGQPLTAAILVGPTHGRVSLKTSGAFTYASAAGYTGADSFSYRASDSVLTSTGVVRLTISASAATPAASGAVPSPGPSVRATTQLPSPVPAGSEPTGSAGGQSGSPSTLPGGPATAPGDSNEGPPWLALLALLAILILGTNIGLYQVVRARRRGAQERHGDA